MVIFHSYVKLPEGKSRNVVYCTASFQEADVGHLWDLRPPKSQFIPPRPADGNMVKGSFVQIPPEPAIKWSQPQPWEPQAEVFANYLSPSSSLYS